jgi:hypothetical protein
VQWIVDGGTQQQGRRQSPDQATADVTGEPVGAAQDYCRSPVAVSSHCAACDSRSSGPVRQPQDDSQNWLFCAIRPQRARHYGAAQTRRSVIVLANYNVPLVTLRDREAR